MTSDDTAPPSGKPAFVAPARAVRLAAKSVASLEELRPVATRTAAEAIKAIRVGSLEHKLAGVNDATEMLRVVNTQLALQRNARLHDSGGKSRQAMRVLSVTVLFALLIAALAALSWMQGKLAGKGFSRHHHVEASGQR